MKTVFKANLFFLFPYILFIIFGALLIFASAKAATHLEFNQHHIPFFDVFFYYATYLGDGITAVFIVLALLFISYRYALITALSVIISAIITQLLKHFVFSDIVRPKKYFEGLQQLYFVPDVENYLYNSFPSGHTTCAFALYFSAAMCCKNNLLKFLFFTIALTAAYSRVYLSQHFFEDVYAGSFIGTITAFFVYYAVQKQNAGWMENSLLTNK